MLRHVQLLHDGLNERGFKQKVAAPEGVKLKGIQTISAPISARPHPVGDLRAAERVARYSADSDILHGHGLRGGWIALLASTICRKPFILTAHNMAPVSPGKLSSLCLRICLQRACAVITVSQAVANSLEPFGLPESITTIIPNGMTLDFLANHSAASIIPEIDPNIPMVGAIGRLALEKGFDILVEAAALVVKQQPEALFVLAGEGAEHAALQQQIKARGMEGKFILAGLLKEVAPLLMRSRLVVVPSRQEGQGIVALEAMAAGRPVVAACVGGLPETVDDGVTGLLVPPEDSRKLADAILQLLGNQLLCLTMGEAGRQKVNRLFTLDQMISRTISVYKMARPK